MSRYAYEISAIWICYYMYICIYICIYIYYMVCVNTIAKLAWWVCGYQSLQVEHPVNMVLWDGAIMYHQSDELICFLNVSFQTRLCRMNNKVLTMYHKCWRFYKLSGECYYSRAPHRPPPYGFVRELKTKWHLSEYVKSPKRTAHTCTPFYFAHNKMCC